MIAKKRSMRLKPGRVSGCIKHRFRREFTDLNTKTEDVRATVAQIQALTEMAAELGDAVKQWKIEEIIPVPLHRSRQRIRGYNQAQILAEELGKRLDLPVNKDAVKRIQKTRPQKVLGSRDRIRNLKGAFGVTKSWIPKKCVLVIDDIYTTGNTIHRVAKVLKNAGAQKVYFLTISIGQGL